MDKKVNMSTTFAMDESTSPSLLQDITLDKTEVGMRNSASSGLTMKEYEEQLKKLTAENFNLKLRVYFVEERLSKVTGISDKEDLIKKNIQLKVTCESQSKELEKKQELLFEASKAFELLQKEHAEEVDKLIKEKDRELADLEEKFTKLETAHKEIKSKFPNLDTMIDPESGIKSFEDYEKQICNLEANLRNEEDRCKELENMLKDNHLELESYELKCQRMENELDQRMNRVEELVKELEQKEHSLASANFRIRMLEDELKSKQREEEIMKERIEEKNKTIESLQNSLASRYDTIATLENRIAKERSSSQTMQSKVDSLSFQNSRLKEELEILQSRFRRSAEVLSPRGKVRSGEDELFKQKYEELVKTMEEQEVQFNKRLKEMEGKVSEKTVEAQGFHDLYEKHKKLEDDHRKACTALKNFIKRSSDEKKEREVLNRMLANHEEVIADLKSELDAYRNNSLPRISQDDKLSLAGTGDNVRNSGCPAPDKAICQSEKDELVSRILCDSTEAGDGIVGKNEKTAIECSCGVEDKIERLLELEAEVIVLNEELEKELEIATDSRESQTSRKELLVTELERKQLEIDRLNEELKERNINLHEILNKELCDKNRKIETLEKKISEIGEMKSDEVIRLREMINIKDDQLDVLKNKLYQLGIPFDFSCSSDGKPKVSRSYDGEVIPENSDSSVVNHPSVDSRQLECNKVKENSQDDSTQYDAAKICALLSARLEELAAFLDLLLRNNELLDGLGVEKREDIKQAMEKSKELSRHLSQSFVKSNRIEASPKLCGRDITSHLDFSTTFFDFFDDKESKDKIVSEQTLIINRLRNQLKHLNHEIKQRDIELSHCQGTNVKVFGGNPDGTCLSDLEGIENISLEICQVSSDDVEEKTDKDAEDRYEKCCEKNESFGVSESEKSRKKILFLPENKTYSLKDNPFQETSESEAWSEPDRSVSLARMGKLGIGILNLSNRNSKFDDTSDSSDGTLNETPKSSGKRCKSAETEIRRLQTKIKALDEANNNLRYELSLIKMGKSDSPSKMQTNEEVGLAEKLRKTMDRLDECSLTCRHLEEKLGAALERASASAVQLSKASETISVLELQINQLKEELKVANFESEEKSRKIANLESKIEEVTIESELKIIEAVKQREAAERKTVEIECRLKDAENMSREVESKVNEIEKRINDTKKFKKETALHFKEAEKHVDTAEKMVEEAERIKLEAERKSKDFQSFIDLMRKEVEDKMKEAERRVKKSEREKEEMEKQVLKLRKKLVDAEKNKAEIESKVKEGKETIQCMEEKLKELEVAMDQCNEEAQRKIKEIQKKAETKVKDLEIKMEEREWLRKSEVEKKMIEAEKISRELETGFRLQLEDAEKKIKKAKEAAESVVKKVQEDAKKQETELRQKIANLEAEKKKECAELLKQLDEAKLEASEFELELTRLTNEKIYLEEELKRMLDKESALVKDNNEIKGKYENSIHELEDKLTQLALNKSQLATRLEEIECTNIDLVSRISAIRGKESPNMERELTSGTSPVFSPSRHGSPLSNLFTELDLCSQVEFLESHGFARQGSTSSDPGEQPLPTHSAEVFAPPRRTMNSSPDLGIDSDPGRFSSLEASQLIIGDHVVTFENSEPVHIKKLECENAELRRRLMRTRQALEETLTQLSAANQRKKQVEKAICKQLHKTHHILKKARVNFETHDGGDTVE